ncbi:MAG: glycogen debranching enzyme family protein [Phycisphaerales bacterium]|nr:glycogen debranching enzyme family protein [Phycisphaerales bacterium]MCB9857723.1 glycogen debranching enzyme family protein [Phycisphaerales bacterium]MCB9863783.1 glycogen debranching enzyme family protein [Phycisphaerales bacterium]
MLLTQMKKPPTNKSRAVHRELRGPFDARTAFDREWLVCNGRGGYASATISQALTRRYHGLLVAATEPPVKRTVLLAKLDVSALVGIQTYELGTNVYRDAIHPQGFALMTSFVAGPRPRWRWRAGAAVIEQSLAMIEGEDTVVVRFRLIEGDSAALSIRPLITNRHFHHLTNAATQGRPAVDSDAHSIDIEWKDSPSVLHMKYTGAFEKANDWYYGFRLPVEQDRGFDCEQDLFTPGTIHATLTRDAASAAIVAAGTRLLGTADALWDRATIGKASTHRKKRRRSKKRGNHASTGQAEHAHRAPINPTQRQDVPNPGDDRQQPDYAQFAENLRESAKQFIVSREDDLRTILAGYPWFGDWGRDTFISLPGLCLSTGRYGDARRIIRMFAKHVDRGMIPNRFPPYGEPPQYNTCDATLWYIHAMDAYVRHTKDWALISETLYPIVCSIVECHIDGTRHGIRVDSDGLLAAGETGHALTWMDAKIGDRTITPRIGKPVEINALWYNAISIAADFAVHARDGIRAKAWCDLAQQCRTAFNERFWNAQSGCLFDIVDVDHVKGTTDDRIRPNQLLAISLPHDILDASRWRSVVDVCERELLTPMGMRTLSPNHPDYRSRYAGDPVARDESYHQGTVWPWLIGPFVSAYVKTHGKDSVPTARKFFDRFITHFEEAGIGGISEIADADAPHAPNGCPWQAWSVAEPLRVLVDDLDVPLATQLQD